MTRPTVFVYTATLAPRDAVSGQAMRHAAILEDLGFNAILVADGVHPFFHHGVIEMDEALSLPSPAGWLVHFGVWSDGIEQLLQSGTGPRVLVHHNTTPAELLPDGLVRKLCQAARDRLPEMATGWTHVIGDSAHNIAELRAAGFDGGEVIPPLMPGVIHDADVPRTHNLMAIGRIAPSKGLDRAVKATAILNQLHRIDGHLQIVGSDDGWEGYAAGLRRLIVVTGAQAELTGSLADHRRDHLYSAVGALIVTSHHEGFCMPLVEAMRAGTPIVAVDVGAVGETLSGAGLLLPADASTELIAEAVAAVLQDPDLARSLSALGRVRASAFDAERVTGALRAVFSNAFSAV